MTRLILLCGVVAYALILPSVLFAQPNCNGSIVIYNANDALPNPSFEELTECPDEISRMDLLVDWDVVSDGTTDPYDLCGDAIDHWEIPDIPLPIPDGTAFVGGLSQFFEDQYVEGLGTTLLTPLIPGQRYELRGFLGLGSESAAFEPLEELTMSAHGSNQTNVLPYFGFQCPPNSLGFQEIGSVTSTGFGEWIEFQMILEPTEQINTLVLIPSCIYQEDQGYWFMDDLSLFELEEVSPSITIALSGVSCQSPLELVASPNLDGYDYQWFRDGVPIVSTTGPTLDLPPGEEGQYNVVVSHPSGSGCISSELITVDLPSFTTTIDTVICEGDAIEIGQELFNLPGSYTIPLTTQGGCDSLVILVLGINPFAEVEVLHDDINCHGDTVTVFVSATGETSPYAIDWQDGNQNWERQLSAGNYPLIITDENNCETQLEYVINQPADLEPLITITDVSCTAATNGSLEIYGAGGVPSYVYQLDDRAAQFGEIASYTGLPAQRFSLKVIDDNGCVYDSLIEVQEPVLLLTDIRIPDEGICQNNPFTAYVVTDQPRYIDSWSWQLSRGTDIESTYFGPEIQVLPAFSGPYKLSAVGTDANGCLYSADTIIFADRCVEFPNGFTPNGDGLNDVFKGPVDRYDQIARIELLEVYSRWGNRVYSSNLNQEWWDGMFHGQDLPEGVYVYTAVIQFVDGEVQQYYGDIFLTR